MTGLCGRNSKPKVSLWERIKCFPFTLRQRNLRTQQSPVIVFEGNSGTGIPYYYIVFDKLSQFKMFSVHTTTQTRRFLIPPVWKERFREAFFSWRISVDGRPSRRITPAFFKFLQRIVDETLVYRCLIEANQTSISTCGRSIFLISVSCFLRERGRRFHSGIFQLAVTFSFVTPCIKPQDWLVSLSDVRRQQSSLTPLL